ncbi:hypothetical protein A9G07_07665 [Gilliamella sp. wkB72]|uniref:WbqC family protein n=1 Tax=Gilliamella sp. wkB72 TaxID=3120265 RepID=UPI0008107C48|nr:WbqC family protein [Gilliamella apicola]OCL22930.1 hypothetical protein A9G07_07665 [Gilliamella apicola]
MKIGIMQPYFFPYMGYWQLINAVDKYVIYDDVNFIKNGWINRNNILLNGKKYLVTLPLDGASSFLLINQIRTTSKTKDKEKVLKTIAQSYKKAPYFENVISIVENTIMNESKFICDALIYSIKSVINYLDIKTEILISSELDKDNSLSSEDKVIHICKLLNGNNYLNAIGGQELYNKSNFEKQNLQLSFLKMNQQNYKQLSNDFVPNLSMIDVLMFNSPSSIREMLNDYEVM